MINEFKKNIPVSFKRTLKRMYNNFMQSFAYKINKTKINNKTQIKKIVFVCHGNICRSSYAEHYCKEKYKDKKIVYESYGLNVIKSKKSPIEAINAAKYFNIDVTKHLSKKISKELLKNSDLIIAMDYVNYTELKMLFPSCKKRLKLLREYDIFPSSLLCNIDDPYGLEYEEYLKCYKLINSCIDEFFNKIH